MNTALLRLLVVLALLGVAGFIAINLFVGEDQGDQQSTQASADPDEPEDDTPVVAPSVEPDKPTMPVPVRTVADTARSADVNVSGGDGGGSLAGRVINPQQNGIEGAEVELMVGPANLAFNLPSARKRTGHETITDSDGTYVFEGIAPGTSYVVVVRHPEYAEKDRVGLTIQPNGMDIVPDILMDHGARVFGIVYTYRGGPIIGARVELWNQLENNFRRNETKEPYAVTETNDVGEYEFTNVHFNACEVVASAEGHATTTKSNTMLFGQVEDRELVFELGPAMGISGQVVDSRGQPISGAMVSAYQVGQRAERGGSRATVASKSDGTFELEGLAEGSYNLSAKAIGYSDKQAGTFEAGELTVRIVMESQGGVSGSVTAAANGSAVTRFRIRMKTVRGGDTAPIPTNRVEEFSSADGSFTMANVDPGHFVLEAEGADFAPTDSQDFFIERGKVTPGIDVAMTRGATVSGVVINKAGEPVAGAVVSLNPNDYVAHPIAEIFRSLPNAVPQREPKARTKKDGSFRLTLLVPGTYQIAVQRDGYSTMSQNNVQLVDDQNTDLGRLSLSAGGGISGKCFDSSGRPYADGTVNCSGPNGGFKTKRPDFDGRFEFTNLPEGEYRITLNPDQMDGAPINPLMKIIYAQKTEQTIYVTNDSTKEINLTLPPPTQGN